MGACSFLSPSLAGGELICSKLVVIAGELACGGRGMPVGPGCGWGGRGTGRGSEEGGRAWEECEFALEAPELRWLCDGGGSIASCVSTTISAPNCPAEELPTTAVDPDSLRWESLACCRCRTGPPPAEEPRPREDALLLRSAPLETLLGGWLEAPGEDDIRLCPWLWESPGRLDGALGGAMILILVCD